MPDYGGDELGCTGRLDFWFLGNWSFSCVEHREKRIEMSKSYKEELIEVFYLKRNRNIEEFLLSSYEIL